MLKNKEYIQTAQGAREDEAQTRTRSDRDEGHAHECKMKTQMIGSEFKHKFEEGNGQKLCEGDNHAKKTREIWGKMACDWL